MSDMHIFVTGIVGRAMGSGKFDADYILTLTERAKDAYIAVFGEPAPQAPPARVGAAQSFGSVAQGMGLGADAEQKPISMWGGDKAYLGWKDNYFEEEREPDVTWGKWLVAAQSGNTHAIEVLKKAAAADPNKGDPKWHAANRKRISRAKAILGMLG